MYYSLIERHDDGSWWYHLRTFTDKEEAEAYLKKWIWWDEGREKMVFEHKDSIPQETLWSYDLKHFYTIAGEQLFTVKERPEDGWLADHMYDFIKEAIKIYACESGDLDEYVEKYYLEVPSRNEDYEKEEDAYYEVFFRSHVRKSYYQGDHDIPSHTKVSYDAQVFNIVLARWNGEEFERTSIAFKPELLVIEDDFYL